MPSTSRRGSAARSRSTVRGMILMYCKQAIGSVSTRRSREARASILFGLELNGNEIFKFFWNFQYNLNKHKGWK